MIPFPSDFQPFKNLKINDLINYSFLSLIIRTITLLRMSLLPAYLAPRIRPPSLPIFVILQLIIVLFVLIIHCLPSSSILVVLCFPIIHLPPFLRPIFLWWFRLVIGGDTVSVGTSIRFEGRVIGSLVLEPVSGI